MSDDIDDLLASLSDEEKLEIRRRLTRPSADTNNVDRTWAHFQIAVERYRMRLPSAAEASKKVGKPAFNEAMEFFTDFVKQGTPDGVGSATHERVCRKLAFVATEAFRHSSIVTPATIIARIPEIPGIIDAMFPGYADERLLNWVLDGR